ncbi:hypothetical protein CDS [Salmonella enterica subsp. enterica serovar Derby]|nr:hypothetical protein CDS [Salmonella enterica subsp. enterica serovar Derby]
MWIAHVAESDHQDPQGHVPRLSLFSMRPPVVGLRGRNMAVSACRFVIQR